ncbi:MAG: hypothetical protein JNM36_01070 [Chitinophagales bacterium]|jgi:hypothetical protein|nr:hypothetical protein [Chitinophagales bacterium]HNI43726.1 hypothetical protein [Chitinophagales bacterium]
MSLIPTMIHNILPPYPATVYCSAATTACFLVTLLTEPFLPYRIAHYLIYIFGLFVPLIQIAYLLYSFQKRPLNFRNIFPIILNIVVIAAFVIKYTVSFNFATT